MKTPIRHTSDSFIDIDRADTAAGAMLSGALERRHISGGLLDAAQCAELCWIQRSQRRAGYMVGLSAVTFRELLAEPALLLPLIVARTRVLEAVEAAFGEILHCEYTGLLCWEPDAIIEPHFDSNRPYLTQRHFSALVYLNDQDDDFTGGSFVFEKPACGVQVVRPHAGLLLAFSSGPENVHWVERVGRGERMVLTLWFTRDAAHSEESLVQHVGPRRERPVLNARDQAAVAATLRRHRLRLRGKLHEEIETACAVSPCAPNPEPASGGEAEHAEDKLVARPLARAHRFVSLNELLQLAAFAEWRHACILGAVLAGEAQAPGALQLWQEWRSYMRALEGEYIRWLPEWWAHGHFHDCGGYSAPSAPPRPLCTLSSVTAAGTGSSAKRRRSC